MLSRYAVLLIALIVLVVGLTGWAVTEWPPDAEVASRQLPPGATDVRDLGNRWLEFRYQGRLYLVRDPGFAQAMLVRQD